MSSYSEIKSDILGIFGFLLLAATAAVALSLFGAAGLIIGVPERFVVPGEARSFFDFRDQLSRGGFFSGVSLVALYGLINLQLALLVDSDEDTLAGLLGLNFVLGVFSFVVIALGDFLIFRVIGLTVGYGMRYVGNPLICLLWLGFGFERFSQRRTLTVVVAFFGIPCIWLTVRVAAEVFEFLFQRVA